MEAYYQPDLRNKSFYLSDEESRHCIKVLRRKAGDEIEVVDGKGYRVKAQITDPNPRKCSFEVLSEKYFDAPDHTIHIALAPTKNQDRVEWFVEKAVEIGIQHIDFYYGNHSERRKINLERIQKEAVAAMKQSGQAFLPVLSEHKSLKNLIREKSAVKEHFIAYVDFDNPDLLMDSASRNSTYVVLIGPEGDFSTEELQSALDSGYKKLSLGNNRLRTETAALAACHILNLVNR